MNTTSLYWKTLEDINTIHFNSISTNDWINKSSNNLTNITQNFPQPAEAYVEIFHVVSVLVPVLFSITVFLGLVGNCLVVYVISSNKRMINSTNILILNLAIADILFLVFCVPFMTAQYALLSWPFGNICCKIVEYFVYLLANSSVYSLVLLAIDRYFAIAKSVTALSLRTKENTFFVILVMWTAIFTLCSPILMLYEQRELVINGMTLFVCGHAKEFLQYRVVYTTAYIIFGYILPLVLIVGLYVFVLREVNRRKNRKRQSVTKMLVIVVGVFAVCWGPLHLISMLNALHLFPMSTATISFGIVSHVMAYSNSCMNPILYAFLSQNFRKAFKQVLPFSKHNHRESLVHVDLTAEKTNSKRITFPPGL